jgi:hypothetical protein
MRRENARTIVYDQSLVKKFMPEFLQRFWHSKQPNTSVKRRLMACLKNLTRWLEQRIRTGSGSDWVKSEMRQYFF